MSEIIVYYNAVDGASAMRRFKTLAGASKFAAKMVGPSPDFGSYYAVSADGIGKVQVKGCALKALFTPPAEAKPFEVWVSTVNEDAGTLSDYMSKAFATLDRASAYVLEIQDECDGVRIKPVGEVAEAEYEAALQQAMSEQYRAEQQAENAVWGAWRGVCL